MIENQQQTLPHDAINFEYHIVDIARSLRTYGRFEDADTVVMSADVLRRTWTEPVGRGMGDAFATLEMIREAASVIQRIIIEVFPEEIALRGR